MKLGKHCSDEVIESVYKIIYNLSGQWLIKLMGGEPMIHPRIFSIVDRIAQNGHMLYFTTNFSLPLDYYKKLAEKLGENLKFLGASLHLEQVKNVDNFIQKAADFQKFKNPKTKFFVSTVFLEDKFPLLKGIAARLDEKGVPFSFQHYKISGKYYEYQDQEIKQFFKSRLSENTKKIRNLNLFGTLCHAGSQLFFIDLQGKIMRCYNRQILFQLGDSRKENFKPLSKPMPCLSQRCSCTVPVNRGMILFGQKANIIQIIQACYEGIKRRIL